MKLKFGYLFSFKKDEIWLQVDDEETYLDVVEKGLPISLFVLLPYAHQVDFTSGD